MGELHLDLHADQRFRLAKEMYLKSILQLSKEGTGEVRPVDLVHCLGVTKGSVSEMLGKLSDDGVIKYKSFKSIQLTSKGRKKADLILRKYHIVRNFLEQIVGMKHDKSHDEACNLEHAFSDDVVELLEKVVRKKSKK